MAKDIDIEGGLRAALDTDALQLEMEWAVAQEVNRMETSIEDMKTSNISTHREIAAFTSAHPARQRYATHAAMLTVLDNMGLLDEYYSTYESPLEDSNVPRHVRLNGWMLILPHRDGLRPVIRHRPGDEGGETFKYSLIMFYIGRRKASRLGYCQP